MLQDRITNISCIFVGFSLFFQFLQTKVLVVFISMELDSSTWILIIMEHDLACILPFGVSGVRENSWQ